MYFIKKLINYFVEKKDDSLKSKSNLLEKNMDDCFLDKPEIEKKYFELLIENELKRNFD